jgi:DNA-binding response OmpR family regulator
MTPNNNPTTSAIAAEPLGSIIVVEDNCSVNEEVCIVLEEAGWAVYSAADAEAFRTLLSQQTVDMVLLDLNLPGEDGISLCKWLRQTYPSIGIVMLTARVMGRERTDGYVAGADVYLTKPTRPEELLAVVHNLFNRRTHAYSDAPKSDPWTLQIRSGRLVSPQLDSLSLTPSECIFLRELALTPEVCSYDQLNEKLGGNGHIDKSHKARLEVIVSRLRTKLSKFSVQVPEIKTVHGVGYQLSGLLKLQARA